MLDRGLTEADHSQLGRLLLRAIKLGLPHATEASSALPVVRPNIPQKIILVLNASTKTLWADLVETVSGGRPAFGAIANLAYQADTFTRQWTNSNSM